MSCCIDLHGVKVSDLSPTAFQQLVAKPLWENGVVCLKRQHGLSQSELVAATALLGNPIRLPRQLAFNNRDATYPEITRVGNIDNDNAKMENYFDAKYWHTDGSFWPEGMNFVTNWLQTVVRPSTGGSTAFIDMQEVYAKILSEEERSAYEKTRFVIRHRNLFAPVVAASAGKKDKKHCDDESGKQHSPSPSSSSEAEQCGIPICVVHNAVYRHPITGIPSLYIGTNNSYMVRAAKEDEGGGGGGGGGAANASSSFSADEEEGTMKRSAVGAVEEDPMSIPLSNDDRGDKIIAAFASDPSTTVHVHEWEDGDVLLWDNAQTMHRGMGGIGPDDRRLLYRTQSQVTQPFIDAYKKACMNDTSVNV